jgi:hypothetical protein
MRNLGNMGGAVELMKPDTGIGTDRDRDAPGEKERSCCGNSLARLAGLFVPAMLGSKASVTNDLGSP